MKKLFTLLLVLLLILVSTGSAAANEQPPYRLYGQEVYSSGCRSFVDEETGYVFYEWKMKLSVDSGRALSGLQFKLKWDPAVLVCHSTFCIGRSATVNEELDIGRVTYAVAASQNFEYGGEDIFILYLRFADGVEDGTRAYIEIDSAFNNSGCYVDSEGSVRTISVDNGLLGVKGGCLVKGYPKGDADGDGLVTAMDASLILRSLVSLAVLEGPALIRADVTYDGNVGANDAAKILRYLVELEDSL